MPNLFFNDTFAVFEERVTLITPTTGNSEGRKLYLVPNKYGPVKHKEIYYYCIKMGTKYSFPLRPYAMANLEAGKNGNPNISTVKTAELITLEFKSEFPICILRLDSGCGKLIYIMAKFYRQRSCREAPGAF